jgi:hypothetical protein
MNLQPLWSEIWMRFCLLAVGKVARKVRKVACQMAHKVAPYFTYFTYLYLFVAK